MLINHFVKIINQLFILTNQLFMMMNHFIKIINYLVNITNQLIIMIIICYEMNIFAAYLIEIPIDQH